MPHWRSISEWGREQEARAFAYIASQYPICEWSKSIAKQIANDERLKIIDAQLTLVLQSAYGQYVINYFGVIYH